MNKSEEAYARLTQKIETGELPPGAILSEADLIAAAETAHAPARGRATPHPRPLAPGRWGRGLQVPPISVDDQLERLEVRRSLEALAVGLACARADEEQLAAVAAHVRHLRTVEDLPAYVAAVGRSNELLRTIANNRYLADSLVPLQGLSRRFWLATTKGLPDEVERGRAFYVRRWRR